MTVKSKTWSDTGWHRDLVDDDVARDVVVGDRAGRLTGKTNSDLVLVDTRTLRPTNTNPRRSPHTQQRGVSDNVHVSAFNGTASQPGS